MIAHNKLNINTGVFKLYHANLKSNKSEKMKCNLWFCYKKQILLNFVLRNRRTFPTFCSECVMWSMWKALRIELQRNFEMGIHIKENTFRNSRCVALLSCSPQYPYQVFLQAHTEVSQGIKGNSICHPKLPGVAICCWECITYS